MEIVRVCHNCAKRGAGLMQACRCTPNPLDAPQRLAVRTLMLNETR
jgi:hypothetical protein